MENSTPLPAARAPIAWYSWWLMPLGLGGGTVTATFMSSERIAVAVAGAAATATSALCVQLLLRARAQLRQVKSAHRTEQDNQVRDSQQQLAELRTRFTVQSAAREEHHAGQASALATQLSDQKGAFESQLEERDRVWQERLDQYLSAVTLLADDQLPASFRQLRDGDSIDDILPVSEQQGSADDRLQSVLNKVLRTALTGVEEELNRSTSAEQAVIGVGNRIQVLTSQLRGRLHEMQGEHDRSPAVAQSLMELDQAVGPADCLAASLVVLGGSDRPGRQWQEPQHLRSVVRGGIGRVKDFRRVQVDQLPDLGVDGGLVDHLTLLFAHLLDNAARYSPPSELVTISGKEVPNGVGIQIQDLGKGLSEEKKREADHALAGTSPGAGLGGISEDANVGLRVVGRLARRYGIRVTFADSPWLGTSVVVVIPHKYFSPLPGPSSPTVAAPAVPAPRNSAVSPVTPVAPLASVASDVVRPADESEGLTTPGGLPRRRRRSDPALQSPSAVPTGRTTDSMVPPDSSFAGMAAFATAARAHPAATPSEPEPAKVSGSTTGGTSAEHHTEESNK